MQQWSPAVCALTDRTTSWWSSLSIKTAWTGGGGTRVTDKIKFYNQTIPTLYPFITTANKHVCQRCATVGYIALLLEINGHLPAIENWATSVVIRWVNKSHPGGLKVSVKRDWQTGSVLMKWAFAGSLTYSGEVYTTEADPRCSFGSSSASSS